MAGWGRARGRESWLLCPMEKVQEAGQGMGMDSQPVGHEQRVSNTAGLTTSLSQGCFWCCARAVSIACA